MHFVAFSFVSSFGVFFCSCVMEFSPILLSEAGDLALQLSEFFA
jgi:hypothetical protein